MEENGEPTNIQNIKVECMTNTNAFSEKRSVINERLNDDRETNSTRDLSTVSSIQNNIEFYEEKLDSIAEIEDLGDSSSNSRQPSNSSGLGIPSGNHYLRNAILDEVLSEKKMALLWSPQVIKFLQDQQMAKRTNF